jgi:hypothetical protein
MILLLVLCCGCANPAAPSPAVLTIVTVSLPSVEAGVLYAQTLTASGGTAPYTWSIVSGQLPTGLVLNPTGEIVGIPTNTGVFIFIVQVIDSNKVAVQIQIDGGINASSQMVLHASVVSADAVKRNGSRQSNSVVNTYS